MSDDSGGGICLVLGAGGFRGLAHVGVLRGLQRLQIAVQSVIGVSMGGLVASFHAGLGYSPEELERRFSGLSTTAIFGLGWSLYRGGKPRSEDSTVVGVFRGILEELRRLDLENLHFGIRSLGLLALDLSSGREVFTASGQASPVSPGAVALGGASIPGLFPWVRQEHTGGVVRLVDGGLSHSLPVERALSPPFSAAKIVVVDLQVRRGFREHDPERWSRLERQHPGRIVRLQPRVDGAGTVFFRSGHAPDLVRWGEAAVLERRQSLC